MIWFTFNSCVENQVEAKCYYQWYQYRNNFVSLFHVIRFYYQCKNLIYDKLADEFFRVLFEVRFLLKYPDVIYIVELRKDCS